MNERQQLIQELEAIASSYEDSPDFECRLVSACIYTILGAFISPKGMRPLVSLMSRFTNQETSNSQPKDNQN